MDKKFAGFLNTYLDVEQAYDTSGYLRPTLMRSMIRTSK